MLTFGSLSEEGRSNGIQGDAIRNIIGQHRSVRVKDNSASLDSLYAVKGCYEVTNIPYSNVLANTLEDVDKLIQFNASKVVPTSQENRTKNRKIRIYKRIA